MGGDGGSIVKRSEQVKVRRKPQVLEPDRTLYSMCALSQEPLELPVVVCEMGLVMKKEAVLKYLLDKDHKTTPNHFNFAHIRALKHVIEVSNVTRLQPYIEMQPGQTSFALLCPLSGVPANGSVPFYIERNCGCIVSEKALGALRTKGKSMLLSGQPVLPVAEECVSCGSQHTARILMWPSTTEQKDSMRLTMLNHRKQLKAKKKKKKSRMMRQLPKTDSKKQGKKRKVSTAAQAQISRKARMSFSTKKQATEAAYKAQNNANLSSLFLTEEERSKRPNFTSTLPIDENKKLYSIQ